MAVTQGTGYTQQTAGGDPENDDVNGKLDLSEEIITISQVQITDLPISFEEIQQAVFDLAAQIKLEQQAMQLQALQQQMTIQLPQGEDNF